MRRLTDIFGLSYTTLRWWKWYRTNRRRRFQQRCASSVDCECSFPQRMTHSSAYNWIEWQKKLSARNNSLLIWVCLEQQDSHVFKSWHHPLPSDNRQVVYFPYSCLASCISAVLHKYLELRYIWHKCTRCEVTGTLAGGIPRKLQLCTEYTCCGKLQKSERLPTALHCSI